MLSRVWNLKHDKTYQCCQFYNKNNNSRAPILEVWSKRPSQIQKKYKNSERHEFLKVFAQIFVGYQIVFIATVKLLENVENWLYGEGFRLAVVVHYHEWYVSKVAPVRR